MLTRKIAEGGMAEVFLANAPLPSGGSQPCVIKRMLPHLQGKPEFVDMFLTEADICTFLRHENLVEVYEASEIDGVYYMAMEYVSGFELDRFLRVLRENEIDCPPALVVMIGRKLAKALDYLHRATSLGGTDLNLVHRDVNPSNVFLLDDGEVKLGDLGVARVEFLESHTGKDAPLKGKLRYLAPELLLKHDTDQRLDIYGLGLTLWELAAGQRAFDLNGDLPVMKAIVDGALPRLHKLRPELPKGLVQVIEKAIAIDPAKRYASAGDLYRDLRALAEKNGEHYTQEQLAGMIEYAHELSGDVAAAVSLEAGEPAPPPPVHTQSKVAHLPAKRTPIWIATAAFIVVAVAALAWWTSRKKTASAPVAVNASAIAAAPVNATNPVATEVPTAVAQPSRPTQTEGATTTKALGSTAPPQPQTVLGSAAKPAAAQSGSDPEPNRKAAFALLKKGHPDKAALLFEQVLKTNPDRADVRYALARAYLDLGRNDDALRESQQALDERQSDPELWLMVANAAAELSRPDLARHAYERVLYLDPHHPKADDIRGRIKTLH